MENLKTKGLCWRCEHRILNIESDGQYQPRCECGDRNHSSCSCYMYRPVRPVALSRNEGDKRPRFVGYVISSRERAAESQPELKLRVI